MKLNQGEANRTADTDRRSQRISDGIREKGYSLTDEIAILRKTVAMLCEKCGVSYDEFVKYNEDAENAKKEDKEANHGEEN